MHQLIRIVMKLFQVVFFSLLYRNAVKKAAIIMIPITKANSSTVSVSFFSTKVVRMLSTFVIYPLWSITP